MLLSSLFRPTAASPASQPASKKIAGDLLALLALHLEHRQEGLLRNIHLADPLHPPLAFLLLFQQLSLS